MKKIKALSLGLLLSLGTEMNIWASAAGEDMAPRLHDRRQAGSAVANLWAARMEKTWRQQNQEIAAIMTAAPILEPFRTAFERFTLQELNGIRFLLTDGVDADLRPELARVLTPLSIDRLQAIAANAERLFRRYTTPDQRRQIIAVLAPLSGDQINAISIHAEELFYRIPLYSSQAIIRAFASLHAGEISSRMAAIRDYTERFATVYPVGAIYRILPILASLDAEHIKAIERIAEMLFIEGDPTTIAALWYGQRPQEEMITTLASFSIDKINAIQRNAKMLSEYGIVTRGQVYIGISRVERQNTMNALAGGDFRADQINAIVRNAKMLFTHDMDIADRINIVRALEWSSEAQINAIGIYVGKLFKLNMDRSNQVSIIRAFANVQASEIPSRVFKILQITESLFKDMNGYAQTKIIERLARLNVEQIQEIALEFEDGMNLGQILAVIKRVASQAAVPSGGPGGASGAASGTVGR